MFKISKTLSKHRFLYDTYHTSICDLMETYAWFVDNVHEQKVNEFLRQALEY